MKFKIYFIMNEYRQGLHYIQGETHWRYPESLEAVLNFTRFDTEKEAEDFCIERGIPYGSINKIVVKV